jgi:hypothetical protein
MWTPDDGPFIPEAEQLALPAARIVKWRRWLEHHPDGDPGEANSIWSQMVHCAHLRDVFTRTFEIAQSNPAMPESSAFFSYLGETYVTTQAVAIRRQCDRSNRVATLGRLLLEISSALESELKSAGIDSTRRQRLERALTEATSKALNMFTVTAPIRALVDERVAHMDQRKIAQDEPRVTVKSLHAALDVIFDVFQNWQRWLTATDTMDMTPVIQHDWEAVFRIPWIPPTS